MGSTYGVLAPSIGFALGSTAEDAGLVAFGVGEDQPAAPILLPEVVQRCRTEGDDPLDLVIAVPVDRFQIEGDTVFITGGQLAGRRQIVEYRVGDAEAHVLDVSVGDFYGMATFRDAEVATG